MGGSWQLRIADTAVRQFIRRERWGNETELVRRARRLFGAPWFWGDFVARGLVVRRVEERGIRGEWLEPPKANKGVIMYIHGGGYVSCSSQTHRP